MRLLKGLEFLDVSAINKKLKKYSINEINNYTKTQTNFEKEEMTVIDRNRVS